MAKLEAHIPEGPIKEKWTNHKNNINVVNPANKRLIDIIVVGTGLAGGSAAASLAEMGYNVFAADVYGVGIRPKPPEAGKEAGKYKSDRKLFRSRMLAGLEILKKDERTDDTRIAAIGYCFGGTGVLEIARAGADISGVVSFHGGLAAGDGMEAKAGEIPAKVLCLQDSSFGNQIQ